MNTGFKCVFLIVTLVTMTIGCAKKDDSSVSAIEDNQPSNQGGSLPVRTEKFKYRFIHDGCTTNEQSFESLAALCQGLQDSNLNNNCAEDLRRAEFAEKCVGQAFVVNRGSAVNVNGQTQIHCVGSVSGLGQTVKVDKLINWDRTQPTKIILVGMEEMADAGEYSLRLYPTSNDGSPSMELFGWFIDNHKNLSDTGPLNAGLRMTHKDSLHNSRKVDLECNATAPDLAPSVIGNSSEITCLGGVESEEKGQKSSLDAHFTWDGKSIKRQNIDVAHPEAFPGKLEVVLTPAQGTTPVSFQIVVKKLDGHIDESAVSIGALDVGIDYLNAWDNRSFKLGCRLTSEWNRIIKDMFKKPTQDGNAGGK